MQIICLQCLLITYTKHLYSGSWSMTQCSCHDGKRSSIHVRIERNQFCVLRHFRREVYQQHQQTSSNHTIIHLQIMIYQIIVTRSEPWDYCCHCQQSANTNDRPTDSRADALWLVGWELPGQINTIEIVCFQNSVCAVDERRLGIRILQQGQVWVSIWIGIATNAQQHFQIRVIALQCGDGAIMTLALVQIQARVQWCQFVVQWVDASVSVYQMRAQRQSWQQVLHGEFAQTCKNKQRMGTETIRLFSSLGIVTIFLLELSDLLLKKKMTINFRWRPYLYIFMFSEFK